jgi:phage gp45-like
MSDGTIKQLAARLRNIFSVGEFQKRYADGNIQVKTVFSQVVEKKEAFPYGFKAKAKKGAVLVLCQGGNYDGFELLPVLDYEGGPELEEGDAALYTESGGWVIVREKGGIEVEAKAGPVTVTTKAGEISVGEDGSIEINGAAGKIILQKTGVIEVEGTAVAVQKGGLPAARQADLVQSTAADDPDFWKWITAVSSAVAALTGGSLTPPAMLMAKITGGSATVTIG